jgi:hypothetical protein
MKTIISTNTTKVKENHSFDRFLKEETDARGRTTIVSSIPLRQVNTDKVRPRQAFAAIDPAFMDKALNKGRRPEKGFGPLQTSDLRGIEDNKKRLVLMAERKAQAARAKVAEPEKAKKARKAKKGK